jgi:hypothetical protein
LHGTTTSQQQHEQILGVLHGEEEATHIEDVAHVEHEALEEDDSEEDDGEVEEREEEEVAGQREASSRSTTC